MPQAAPVDPIQALIQAVQQETQGEHPPVADFTAGKANQQMQPNPPEDDGRDAIEKRKNRMAALYGPDFPLIEALTEASTHGIQDFSPQSLAQLTTNDEWVSWVRGRWDAHRASTTTHLYLCERNRLFRASQQWVSSKGRGPWREPPRQAESARVVYNMIKPALDQRLQVITDQRPGFAVEPENLSPDAKRKAEARQQALEFAYQAQEMDRYMQEAAYWAGTDGVAFWHVYWDRDAGPLDERMGDHPGDAKPLGDIRTETYRVEEVRTSSNATATQRPIYQILRKVIPETQAVLEYGDAAVQIKAQQSGNAGMGAGSQLYESGMPNWVLDLTNPGEAERMRNVNTVERFILYVEKDPDLLPTGLQIVVVGNAVVWGPDELLWGVLPVVPVRDGSSDPSYLPRPIMEDWIDDQMRTNAALSLATNSIRVNAGGRFLARPNAISRETFVGGGASIIEVEGGSVLSDVIQPVNGFSVGEDVWSMIKFSIDGFEKKSGWNDTSRGQIASDASGRAILAAREQLERVFAPPVQAVSRAYVDWAKIVLAGMAWGYDVPRDLSISGTGRPDLARQLSKQDFAGPASVKVDQETLMPMPRTFRQFMLDTWRQQGLITNQQYLRRVGFGTLSDVDTPDEDQEARAKRVADAIRMGQPVPMQPAMIPQQVMGVDPMTGQPVPQTQMVPNPQFDPSQPLALRWQDNEAIHQDVLEREIILQDDIEPQIVAVAQARWKLCADQAAQKQGGGGPPASPGPQAAAPKGPPSPFTPSPVTQPLGNTNPSIPVAPVSDQTRAAGAFEAIHPH